MKPSELLLPVASAILQNESLYEREVQLSWLKALNTMRGEMQSVYDKYTKSGVLTKTEMFNYNRYAAMEKQMMEKIAPALKNKIVTIRNFLPEQYKEVFCRNGWTFENSIGVVLLRNEVLTELFSITDEKNQFMNKALQNYSMDARREIRKALMNGLSLGKSPTFMANNLKKTLDISNEEALQIIRTEGMAAMNHGTYDSYIIAIQSGVRGKITWMAAKDRETRTSHGIMDGQFMQEDGFFHLPNGEKTPFPGWEGLSTAERVNCRCTLCMSIDGLEPKLMRTREDGIIPYMTFTEWAKKKGWTEEKGWPSESDAAKNWAESERLARAKSWAEAASKTNEKDWPQEDGWAQEQEIIE